MNNLSEEKINPIPERPLRHLTRPLGIFDSGMGGMSIMAPLAQSLQGTCYYVADDAYAPYGPKTKTEILARADLITRQLLAWGCQLVLVACNTATAAAIKELRERFPIPLVGVEPYLNFLHQAALPPQASLAALMTPATFASEKYQQLKHKLDPQNQIQDFTMPRLASLIEAAVAQKYAPAAIKTIQEELRPLQGRGITHVILGCTHYPLIAELIEDFLG
ncbi:MAG: aspartate/glutamate racemase family protein, partial [Bacteriovoracaceae bacterium]|nr:aspartate/glutamate racemase family protein [Bacteriovoracaceae bacterium]